MIKQEDISAAWESAVARLNGACPGTIQQAAAAPAGVTFETFGLTPECDDSPLKDQIFRFALQAFRALGSPNKGRLYVKTEPRLSDRPVTPEAPFALVTAEFGYAPDPDLIRRVFEWHAAHPELGPAVDSCASWGPR